MLEVISNFNISLNLRKYDFFFLLFVYTILVSIFVVLLYFSSNPFKLFILVSFIFFNFGSF